MKIVILDINTISRNDLDFSCIDALGETSYYPVLPPAQIVSVLKGAGAVLINKANMTKEIIGQLPDLKYIGLFATGYNNVDLAAASSNNVAVVNIPGYSTDAVAQHVFAFFLMHASRISQYNEAVHKGEWVLSDTFSFFPYPITELAGKTLGIIGFGNIGKKVGRIGHAFGMRVMFATRTVPSETDFPCENVSLQTLLKESDYLTLHCPLTAQTENLINKKTLRMMKPTAFLVNTSRGGTVDSAALKDALNEGIIAGAGIDVLTKEPMEPDDPLLLAKNCILTPHIGWAAIEARRRCVKMAAENLAAFLRGEPRNVVNEIRF